MANDRVITYIDGYNLYHGMMQARLGSSRWLDLSAMGRSLLKPHQQLVLTRYFTTRVRGNPGKARRQGTFIDALLARGGIEIDFGHFLSKPISCNSCGNTWQKNEEKKTDVNIAVRLLDDAYDDRFDVAIIISGDSDLVPPIESVRARFPHKRLLVAFPLAGNSSELRRVADAAFQISEAKIRGSRLPDPVTTTGGVVLTRSARLAPTLVTPGLAYLSAILTESDLAASRVISRRGFGTNLQLCLQFFAAEDRRSGADGTGH